MCCPQVPVREEQSRTLLIHGYERTPPHFLTRVSQHCGGTQSCSLARLKRLRTAVLRLGRGQYSSVSVCRIPWRRTAMEAVEVALRRIDALARELRAEANSSSSGIQFECRNHTRTCKGFGQQVGIMSKQIGSLHATRAGLPHCERHRRRRRPVRPGSPLLRRTWVP